MAPLVEARGLGLPTFNAVATETLPVVTVPLVTETLPLKVAFIPYIPPVVLISPRRVIYHLSAEPFQNPS